MIGIKIGIVILSLFISSSESIDLILPLSEEDAPNFHVTKYFLTDIMSNGEKAHNCMKYDSLPNDLIRRVVYHGVELFNDTSEHEPDFKRRVFYATTNQRVILGISKIESGVTTIEQVIGVSRDLISIFNRTPDFPEGLIRDNDTSLIGVLLSSIFKRRENTKKREYDELDSVDDEPYLLRGSADISPKKIKKEVEDIIGNENSTPVDLSAPGPSGITKPSSVKKEEKKDEIEEDSDSD